MFCSRFHDAGGKAVLIGDAAHAMSNALGQGCNSSLQVRTLYSKYISGNFNSNAFLLWFTID